MVVDVLIMKKNNRRPEKERFPFDYMSDQGRLYERNHVSIGLERWVNFI